MQVETVALGLDLRLARTEDGGRQTPLLGGHDEQHRFQYRPNWGLPGWQDGDQTMGPVLGFSRSHIHPGEETRAVIVAVLIESVPDWRSVGLGAELRMYEGSRICGRAIVRWVEPATWLMPIDEQARHAQWLSTPNVPNDGERV